MKKIKRTITKKKAAKVQVMLDQAIHYQAEGNYLDSEGILNKILEIDPCSASAYHYLALIAEKHNHLEGGLSLLEKSISLNPKDANVYYNYGVLLRDSNRLQDATEAYQSAVALNKKMDLGWLQLANIYYKMHKYQLVIHALNQLLKIPNHRLSFYPEMIRLYFDVGDMASCVPLCKKALEANIGHDYALWILVNSQQLTHKSTQFLAQIKTYLSAGNLGSELMMRLTIFQAIAEWQLGYLNHCRCSIELSSQWSDTFDLNAENKSLFSYRTMLTKLLNYAESHPYTKSTNQNIYLVGDSHSLTHNNQTLSINGKNFHPVSYLLLGCKAFHLAQPRENNFKASFNKAIALLPESSTMIIMLGDIDCRLNEGIFPTFKKGKKALSELILETVSNYVSFVVDQTKGKGIQVYFYGVAAPQRIKNASEEDMLLLKNIILLFNQTLQNCALHAKSKFIDIYNLTVVHNGLSNGYYHIDDVHLLPKVIEDAKVL